MGWMTIPPFAMFWSSTYADWLYGKELKEHYFLETPL